jgi:hypothetical protein
MKFTVILLILSFSNAQAGTFLRKGLYVTNDLSIGFGKTVALAEADAAKAIPKGYKLDKKNNSPAITCAFKEIPNDKNECANEDVRVEIPLIAI